MARRVAFWVLMLIWLVFGLAWWGGAIGHHGVYGNTVMLFFLIGLLGWDVYGRPLE